MEKIHEILLHELRDYLHVAIVKYLEEKGMEGNGYELNIDLRQKVNSGIISETNVNICIKKQ
jgi:hypothetical protein